MTTPDPRLYWPTWTPPPAPDESAEELRLVALALRDMAKALDEISAERGGLS